MAKVYNIFFSHSWSYGDQYDRLKDLLIARGYFTFKDYSVPKDDPIHNAPNSPALYTAIKNHITPCHIVIIMAGVYATYSSWIQKEIKIAKHEFSSPKPIIAIRPRGNERISTVVQDAADEIVGWNTESVVNAIRRLA